jgi:hypothetical protein
MRISNNRKRIILNRIKSKELIVVRRKKSRNSQLMTKKKLLTFD